MLTALAQSFLPSSTNQHVNLVALIRSRSPSSLQQLLADLQVAASLGNKPKLSSEHSHGSQHDLHSHLPSNRTDHHEHIPHLTQAKRRATHNAVERRRRDRINQHIQQLAKLIPDCSNYVKNQVRVVRLRAVHLTAIVLE